MGLLRGNALAWATAVWDSQSAQFNSFSSFTAELKKVFDNPLYGKEAGNEPMQLGRAHLTPAERLRRLKAGECIYCGNLGHFLATCPLRPKEKARQ